MQQTGVRNERRWALRRDIEIDAVVVKLDDVCYTAKIMDMSEEGCSVQLASGSSLVPDHVYAVNITGLPPLNAHVIWSLDSKAGLSFYEPLNLVTIQRLTAKSLYGRLIQAQTRSGQTEDHMENLPRFPFD